MAPQLWLLRHGEAVPNESKPDAARELNIEPEEEDALTDGFDREDALEILYRHGGDARVLVVGHDPSFSQVVHDLTGARIDFKKGGVAVVRAERTGGELLALLRPRELESLARTELPKG